ncbi:unnamed protein product [Rotaria sp. Silwood2]|nr:unnamed protein product [Rotaria sp. Silwood2]CAF2578367.1 unnamed protein product [Rotaria sp. Silwood2]CAF2986387.1 unnamed protein product [Rotaria sp. Silwood2]CAF3953268.1 unnamed protein product [Rotaria sp. Silwood2]CAF4103784.1 unnamed protein product [Rotaria sp. Silwood2]
MRLSIETFIVHALTTSTTYCDFITSAVKLNCTANALASKQEFNDVSRLFIYYNTQVRGKSLDRKIEDQSSSITYALEELKESGTYLKSIWPYDIKQINQRSSVEAFEAAKNNWIINALEINIDLNEMKICLGQRYAFVFCLELYKSFEEGKQKSIIPMSKSGDTTTDQA